MSLMERIKKGFEERKKSKQERKAIEAEAKQLAHQEYLETFKKERVSVLKAEAQAKAKREAHGRSLTMKGLGGAKSIGNILSTAGKNFLESDQFTMPTVDLGFGTTQKKGKGKKKKRKAKIFNPLEF